MQHTFFCTFFAIVLHPYNVKLPETSLLHVFWRKCRSCSSSLLFFTALIFTLHWWPLAFPILSPPLQNFHVVLPTKKRLLCLLSLAQDRLLSLFLCLSPPLYSKFVATREKKSCALRFNGKKGIIREMPGIKKKKKKLSVKKFSPPPPLFILIDGCPSRPSTMTATATSRNVNYLRWRCTTTTWNVLISRSMEYLNIRQRFLFLFLNFDRDLWNLTPEKRISPASGKLKEME